MFHPKYSEVGLDDCSVSTMVPAVDRSPGEDHLEGTANQGSMMVSSLKMRT